MSHLTYGALLGLTVSEKARGSGVGKRLLKEAAMYLKVRGCESLALRLPADAGKDAQLFQDNGFQVVAWELEKPL
jgi:GNAT superfamily N-acetyltransferase